MNHDEKIARIERIKANVADIKANIQSYSVHDNVSVRDIRVKMNTALSQGIDGKADDEALLAIIQLGIEAIDAQELAAEVMARNVRSAVAIKEVALS